MNSRLNNLHIEMSICGTYQANMCQCVGASVLSMVLTIEFLVCRNDNIGNNSLSHSLIIVHFSPFSLPLSFYLRSTGHTVVVPTELVQCGK